MDLQDPAVVCSLLDLSPILTGQQPGVAAETVRRQRKVLVSAVQYGIERGMFEGNPVLRARWRIPKTAAQVDPRVVVNP